MRIISAFRSMRWQRHRGDPGGSLHCDGYADGKIRQSTKKVLARHGGEALCFMSDEDVAARAKETGSTRAAACMEKAAELDKKLIIAVGNAPTALVRLYELIGEGKIKTGADHRSSGRLCQCGGGKGNDPAHRCAMYREPGKKRRQQCGCCDL